MFQKFLTSIGGKGMLICKCGATLENFPHKKCTCCYETPVINGIYQFTEDAPISTDNNSLQWLGYEHVGDNYEPGYFYDKANDTVGNSHNLAKFLGKGKVVLDLGAGLGGHAISFALAGLNVIAADISQVMLEHARERAQQHNAANIIFTRMNGYKLALAADSIDAVLEVDMLRQVNQPDLVIDEIKRVLKPGGFLLQYGQSESLGYTKEQEADNDMYNTALWDIQNYYDKQIQESGYIGRIFSGWEQAENSVKENFTPHTTIKNTGLYVVNNRQWLLRMGLHKLKTKASGVKQFLPEEIHNAAWENTHAYAISKYGAEYENISRWVNSSSSIVAYTVI